MRSTDRRRGQRGTSLIEAVVASALMGIGVVSGLTAWDTASTSAAKAVRIAWANCVVRSEMDAILSARYLPPPPPPMTSSYPVPAQFANDGTVEVDVGPWRGNGGGIEEVVTVKAYDPTSHHTVVLAQASALKASALPGNEQPDNPMTDVAQGCPRR
jgi:Tfp pilus assembly protein PilV